MAKLLGEQVVVPRKGSAAAAPESRLDVVVLPSRGSERVRGRKGRVQQLSRKIAEPRRLPRDGPSAALDAHHTTPRRTTPPSLPSSAIVPVPARRQPCRAPSGAEIKGERRACRDRVSTQRRLTARTHAAAPQLQQVPSPPPVNIDSQNHRRARPAAPSPAIASCP
jgi:hypothetical protein